MSERTVSLILAFLHNRQNKIFGIVQTSKHEEGIPHFCITFNYQGNDVEVCVYNDNFIRVYVDEQPWTICDGIKSLRDAIFKLDHYNYGYRHCL
jgi:hypothetical protein